MQEISKEKSPFVAKVCLVPKCLGEGALRTNQNTLNVSLCCTLEIGCMLKILFISCIAGEDRPERTSFHYNSCVIK